MTKHLVFFHQNYPSQFGPIIPFLLENYDVKISFFSEFKAKPIHPEVNHYFYKPDQSGDPQNPYFFSRYFELESRSIVGVYNAVQAANLENPDVFVGHVGFGNLMFLHAEYPQVPSVGYFEIFYNPFELEMNHRRDFPSQKPNMLRVPLRNATQLLELEYCTKGYSPTPFQKSTFPSAYQDKLHTLFDGVDTAFYCPGEVKNSTELNRTWPVDAKLVTFVSRGLESFRGFDLFMEVAYMVSQKRPDVHFVIAGNPKTHYGPDLMSIKEETFKEHVLKKHPFDLSRFHFLDWVSESALVDLFRLSDCHFYWTIPFTLSWSLFQAMSTGCYIVASDSAPVRDALANTVNGFLIPPNEIEGFVHQILTVLDSPKQYVSIKTEARETILEKFSFKVCHPQLADFYLSF